MRWKHLQDRISFTSDGKSNDMADLLAEGMYRKAQCGL
jgi:hypothetical protein